MKGTRSKIKAAPAETARARAAVLQALAARPRTGAELLDDLAARCGGKEAVSRALYWAKAHGFTTCTAPRGGTWSLTEDGRARQERAVLTAEDKAEIGAALVALARSGYGTEERAEARRQVRRLFPDANLDALTWGVLCVLDAGREDGEQEAARRAAGGARS